MNTLTASSQNICNLIGREECSIGPVVLSASIVLSDKKTTAFNFHGVQK